MQQNPVSGTKKTTTFRLAIRQKKFVSIITSKTVSLSKINLFSPENFKIKIRIIFMQVFLSEWQKTDALFTRSLF